MYFRDISLTTTPYNEKFHLVLTTNIFHLKNKSFLDFKDPANAIYLELLHFALETYFCFHKI